MMDGIKNDMYEEASLHGCAQLVHTMTLKNLCVLTHV